MAQRFTLKDNPIFQRTEVPVPQPKTAADLDENNAHPDTSEPEAPPVSAPTTRVDITQARNTQVIYTQVEITHVNIAVNYYRMDNEVNDRLALLQTPSEQVVYQRLYRLSYGFHRNVCQVSIHALRDQTNLKSDKTVKTALQGLITKKHIARIGGPNYSPTGGNTYRVYLPHEILPGPSKTKVEITQVNTTQVETPLPTEVDTTQVNFASQNILEVSSLHNNDTHTACVLEDKFANLNPKTLDQLLIQYGIAQVQLAMDVLNYQWHQGQGAQPSAPVAVLKSVLAEGVTIPEGFVSREQRQTIEQRERERKEQRRRDEERRQEDERKLKALRGRLSPEDMRQLREKAEERIGQELGLKRGELGFTTMLVQAKENELLREQYLNQSGAP